MFQTALMLINNRIIKEPIFQTVSKNGLRLSEKQKRVRSHSTQATSRLEVLYELWLALIIKLESFC